MQIADLYRLARRLGAIAEDAAQAAGHESAAEALVTGDLAAAGPSPIGAVAARTGLAQSFVSRLADRLVEAGTAERRADPEDGRRALVALRSPPAPANEAAAIAAATATLLPGHDPATRAFVLRQIATLAAWFED